jgi:hypothetical protein
MDNHLFSSYPKLGLKLRFRVGLAPPDHQRASELVQGDGKRVGNKVGKSTSVKKRGAAICQQLFFHWAQRESLVMVFPMLQTHLSPIVTLAEFALE